MRLRTIKPGYFTNEILCELPPTTRLLYAGLWCLADRAGRLEDRPKRIGAEVLPYDDVDAHAALQALHDYGFIVRYVADGSRFIAIPSWEKHQNPHMKERDSTIPAPCKHSASTVQAQLLPGKGSDEPGGVLGLGSCLLDLDKDSMPRAEPEAAAAVAPQKAARSKPLAVHDLALSLADFHAKAVRNWKPDARVNPRSTRSLRGFDAMVRIDGRHPDRIRELLRFLFGGEPDDYQGTAKFDWRPNLLSGQTLREHWDQIESLYDNHALGRDNGNGRR